MPKSKFTKDPDDVLDYSVPWTDDPSWVDGDIIVASTFTVDPATVPDGDTAPLLVDSDDFTDTATKVWVSGGTSGVTYEVVNHVTTSGGREMDKVLFYKISEYAR
jgi:hypothetical protein